MQAATHHGTGDIRIEEPSVSEIENSTDAVIRITHTAICGSDLWFYRENENPEEGLAVGHEPMGIVEGGV